MAKSASLLLLGLLFAGCSTHKGDRGIATSLIRYDYGENIFRVLPTDAKTNKIWVTLVRDDVESDSCNSSYFGSAPVIEKRYVTERVIPAIQPYPRRRICTKPTITEDGRTIPGVCPPLTSRVIVKPSHTENIIFGYKLDIDGIRTNERGCVGPGENKITKKTVVSAPIELAVNSRMGLTIGVPENISRIEVTTIAPKLVEPVSGTHVIELK